MYLGGDEQLLTRADALVQRALDAGADLLHTFSSPLAHAQAPRRHLLIAVVAGAIDVPPADFNRLIHHAAHHARRSLR